jgi:hypothetical protein
VDATGKPFDPNLHEAVSQQESDTVAEGQVLQQLRKGYKLRERLLRPATVIVAKARRRIQNEKFKIKKHLIRPFFCIFNF